MGLSKLKVIRITGLFSNFCFYKVHIKFKKGQTELWYPDRNCLGACWRLGTEHLLEGGTRDVSGKNCPYIEWRGARLHAELLQSCPTLCNAMDCSPPGSSVHGILQTGILEWVAILFSRESSQPRDQTWVSCIAGRFLTFWVTRKTQG